MIIKDLAIWMLLLYISIINVTGYIGHENDRMCFFFFIDIIIFHSFFVLEIGSSDATLTKRFARSLLNVSYCSLLRYY